jgi:hypothetical protein
VLLLGLQLNSEYIAMSVYVSLQLELDIDTYQAAKECQYGTRGKALINIFECIENFFKHLQTRGWWDWKN